MKIIDDEIETTINDLDDFFEHDKKTTYIFTSSYGSGILNDKERSQKTLFLAWGAGIIRYPNIEQFYLQVTNTIGIGINQSDIAPMISTLLDINFPAHSDGQVPFHLLNISTQNIGTEHLFVKLTL